jgi:hypothetical protein
MTLAKNLGGRVGVTKIFRGEGSKIFVKKWHFLAKKVNNFFKNAMFF